MKPVAGSRSVPRASIYAVISRIPKGRVATYGQVAALAGFPRHARLVGYALGALDDESAVPWQRVVNARGRISPRGEESPMAAVQRFLLEKEGVVFDTRDRISLSRFQWDPRDDRPFGVRPRPRLGRLPATVPGSTPRRGARRKIRKDEEKK